MVCGEGKKQAHKQTGQVLFTRLFPYESVK